MMSFFVHFIFYFCLDFSVKELGIVSHNSKIDFSNALYVTMNNMSSISSSISNIHLQSINGELNSTLDLKQFSKVCFPDTYQDTYKDTYQDTYKEIIKIEYHLPGNRTRDFYFSLVYENESYYKFTINSSTVLKFILGSVIINCIKGHTKTSSQLLDTILNLEMEHLGVTLRGFSSYGSLYSYYTNFFISNKMKFSSIEDAFSKFMEYYLDIRYLRHKYSSPNSLLRDHLVDALYCAIDFSSISKKLRDEQNHNHNLYNHNLYNSYSNYSYNSYNNQFINYCFEEEASIYIIKYVYIEFKGITGLIKYEYCTKDMKPLHKSNCRNKKTTNNLNILIPKEDINTLGIHYVRIECKDKIVYIRVK